MREDGRQSELAEARRATEEGLRTGLDDGPLLPSGHAQALLDEREPGWRTVLKADAADLVRVSAELAGAATWLERAVGPKSPTVIQVREAARQLDAMSLRWLRRVL